MIRPRSKLRRGEPTKEEKQTARIACCNRAGEACEHCGKYTPLELGQLHHRHAKRRFGWMESSAQQHVWLDAGCHHAIHNPKVIPPKQI